MRLESSTRRYSTSPEISPKKNSSQYSPVPPNMRRSLTPSRPASCSSTYARKSLLVGMAADASAKKVFQGRARQDGAPAASRDGFTAALKNLFLQSRLPTYLREVNPR